MSKKYYPEIDGLRAVAVICVLLFHLNPKGIMPGGYLGVDVFFVISGYLITGIIFNDMQQGTFHYFQFLGRRIARLYPALLFTVFLILVAGFLVQDAAMYASTARTLKYTLFSLANISLMKQEGYWEPQSIDNPALHTWSLGVEQQFYLIFPLILYFVYKQYKTQRSVVISISIISIVSFLYAQVFSLHYATANFYFTIPRLFELGLGGLLAVERRKYKNITNIKKELFFSLGFILILVCISFYSSNMKYHPGITTLPIILGSLLCIGCCDAKYAGYILRNKLAVYVGKISYSIYLIHWPLIVFCRLAPQERELTSFAQSILFVLSVLFASVMHHCIENKYRRISISFFSKTGKVFIAIFTIILTINCIVYHSGGVTQRLTPYPKTVEELSNTAGSIVPWKNLQKIGVVDKDPIAIFVGDSYLAQYVEQVDLYFKRKDQSALFLAASACTSTNIHWWTTKECVRNTKYYYESFNKHLPIIRINNWSEMFENAAKGKLYNETLRSENVNPRDIFNEIVSQQEKGKNNILFILPPPLFTKKNSPLGKAPIYEFFPIELSATMQYKSDTDRVNANNTMIQFISEQPSMEYIETYNFFCKDSFCRNIDPSSGIFYYYDYGHLSRYGAKLVWDKIGDQVYDFILRNNPEVKESTP